tara:strand:- start:242 stop:508 length:267 start_codon:yes stop_codon:yes gene_type:complete
VSRFYRGFNQPQGCTAKNPHLKPYGVFLMTCITARNTKQEIIDEAVPLIEDQAKQIQDLKEKLNATVILLGFTAAIAALSARVATLFA